MACGLEQYLPLVYGLFGGTIFLMGGSAYFLAKDYLTKQKLSKAVKTLDVKV